MTSVNEFLWVVVSPSLADKDVTFQLSIRTLIFSLTTSKTTSRRKGQSVLPILWAKKTAETIRKSKLNRSSSHATKISKEIEEMQIADEAATETVNDTQMVATKVTTQENRVSISWWKKSDRKSKTQRNSGRIYLTRRATVMNSRPLLTVITAGMVKPSTGEIWPAEMFVVFDSNCEFYCRYIPLTKPSDVPSSANARQNQIVAQQVHTLKTTINHLKNAYNGNDIEWSESGKLNCIIL